MRQQGSDFPPKRLIASADAPQESSAPCFRLLKSGVVQAFDRLPALTSHVARRPSTPAAATPCAVSCYGLFVAQRSSFNVADLPSSFKRTAKSRWVKRRTLHCQIVCSCFFDKLSELVTSSEAKNLALSACPEKAQSEILRRSPRRPPRDDIRSGYGREAALRAACVAPRQTMCNKLLQYSSLGTFINTPLLHALTLDMTIEAAILAPKSDSDNRIKFGHKGGEGKLKDGRRDEARPCLAQSSIRGRKLRFISEGMCGLFHAGRSSAACR